MGPYWYALDRSRRPCGSLSGGTLGREAFASPTSRRRLLPIWTAITEADRRWPSSGNARLSRRSNPKILIRHSAGRMVIMSIS